MSRTAPFTNAAPSEARKTTAAAISARLTDPTDRDLLGERVQALPGERAPQALRVHVARRDGVDGDAVRAELAGGGAGERDHARLGRAVVAERRPSPDAPVDRRGIDDPPPALAHHVRCRVLQAQEGPGEVGVHHQMPRALVEVEERHVELGPEGAGVVDQDVEAPERPHDLVHRVAHLVRPADVRPHDQRAPAGGPAPARRLLGPREVRVGHDRHVGAGLGHSDGLRAPDPRRAAGDQGDAGLAPGRTRHPALLLVWRARGAAPAPARNESPPTPVPIIARRAGPRQPLRPVVAMPRIMNFWETA